MKNLLFICSRNKWRSPTGEQIWHRSAQVNTRSAGTSPRARRTVNEKDIAWADLVFAMEKKHKNRLLARFPQALRFKEIVVLNIPDDYGFMDTELVELMNDLVTPYLE